MLLGSKPGLDTTRALLKEMGDPQEQTDYVHVGGTNGKGSVSFIIASILAKAGYKTGHYSSPHLVSYCERFTIDDVPITPQELKGYLDLVEARSLIIQEKGWPHPTEFEVLTAVAFQYFRDRNVDIAVLEVGMGGIYDATNVITPLVAVITSISRDHTSFLGETIREIAGNKAGIIKKGVPVVIGSMDEEAQEVIRDQASRLGSPVISSQSQAVEMVENRGINGQMVSFPGPHDVPAIVYYSLPGRYQRDNLAAALTALACLKEQGYEISARARQEGPGTLFIRGRLQVLQENPLVIADAAHNEAGSKALAYSLKEILPGRSKVVVIGIVDDKDAPSIIMSLGEDTKAVIITRPAGERSENWTRVVNSWQELFPDIRAEAEEDIHRAIARGLSLVSGDDYLLVTGSFYVLRQAVQLF